MNLIGKLGQFAHYPKQHGFADAISFRTGHLYKELPSVTVLTVFPCGFNFLAEIVNGLDAFGLGIVTNSKSVLVTQVLWYGVALETGKETVEVT